MALAEGDCNTITIEVTVRRRYRDLQGHGDRAVRGDQPKAQCCSTLSLSEVMPLSPGFSSEID